MNAQQTKALIDVARKAREALLALEPDSIVALELWTAIHRATQEPAKPARTKKIAKASYGPHAWRDGKCLDADDARAFAQSVHDYFAKSHKIVNRTLAEDRPAINARLQRDALRERLSYCACGGKAGNHSEDKDGNLLKCSHCDGCA